MNEPAYPFQEGPLEYTYRFESVSEQAVIQKVVLFTETSRAGLFNMALVDELSDGELSDIVVSNNEDLIMVLATVFRIAEHFLNRSPSYGIIFQGSDERRTRLYRIAISRELAVLSKTYELFGFKNDRFTLFQSNQDYERFLIRRRS
ncbi:DUF6934 family protein [Spirosoma rhododendri]|uniref:Uncharacterized protein n=1 Tax=Spirosoma rhododendri TaxID=2728024 RepID=A0A7L5DQ67_9BACT|nr:hypothetical protein [Spirosoma rhododendri]QJD79353.1 hypothetical protein HH216_13710 [Spirosoma rhododendri]